MFNSYNIDDFQQNGQKALSFLTSEITHLSSQNVFPDCKPGFLRRLLPEDPPMDPEKFEDILRDTKDYIIPNMTHWQHPNFFAYFPSTVHYSAALAEMIGTALNAPGFTWYSNPASTELENVMCDWAAKSLDLPEKCLLKNGGGGCIYNTLGESIMLSVHAAKYKKRQELEIDTADPMTLNFVGYYSGLCHLSTKKALVLKDIPHIREIPVERDPKTNKIRSNVSKFVEMLERDINEGLIPVWLGTTIGSTCTGGDDEIEEFGKICKQNKIWLNVDAAWAGGFLICPEYHEEYAKGLELADSIEVNFGKMMNVGVALALLWVQDRKIYTEAISGSKDENPEYLQNQYSQEHDVTDYKDWHISLSKKFHSLRMWYMFRSLGVNKIRENLRHSCEMAKLVEDFVESHGRLELFCRRELSLVCFRVASSRDGTLYDDKTANKKNKLLLEKINESGKVHLSGSMMLGVYFVRFVTGNAGTGEKEVNEFCEEVGKALEKVE